MKLIGQFAKEHDVTIKTLHHYERLGLLYPESVDEESGYRYYSHVQSGDLRVILFLKDLGLSLSEIKDVMSESFTTQDLLDFMNEKRQQSVQDIDSSNKRLYKLDAVIQQLNNKTHSNTNFKELLQLSEEELYTGKYGRGKFIEEAEKMFNKAKDEGHKLSVIQMDLDKFHAINQTFGYEIGDIVLRRTSDEILSVIKRSEFTSLLERKGGDEFSVVVMASPRQASKLASEILNAVATVDYSDVAEGLKVSITAGIAGLDRASKSFSDLTHKATIALFEQKRR
jgi:diguanylate cyclase (GGDEF)-like protein